MIRFPVGGVQLPRACPNLSRSAVRRPIDTRISGAFRRCANVVVWMTPILAGCHLVGVTPKISDNAAAETSPARTSETKPVQTVSFEQTSSAVGLNFASGSANENIPNQPPRIEDYDQLPRVTMSLDAAVQLALQNNTIIGDLGGRVLSMPDTVQSTFDACLVQTHPTMGAEAALSAYDTQFESGFIFNGGGSGVNSAFSSGQFGVFAQPETLAKIGFAKVLPGGTAVSVGGVAGYDEELAGGAYAALGGEVRHPLLRGAGRKTQRITGPLHRPGVYGGILIAKSKQHQAGLALEQAVDKLVIDVATTYWELHYAHLNVATKQTSLKNAAESWQREQQRVEAAESPADRAAQAHQQFCAAEAALANAIGGTGSFGGGVYAAELRLRNLLGLPTVDGRLIVPDATPLSAEIRFDWHESVQIAHTNRVELRRQAEQIRLAEMEATAARNMQLPQVDLLGAYRKLGDDPDQESPLFNEALDGWQVGVEIRRAVSNRLENVAVRHARLRVSREIAVLQSQRQLVNAELQTAMTQLDRAYWVMRSMTAAEQSASIRLAAETERHKVGDHLIEQVLDAQLRLTEASSARQRAIVDYNLAFLKMHHARGTLLSTIGVAIAASNSDEVRFAQLSPSAYTQTH